ncbi:MAG: HipA family kinase [Ghiorsea sp.]
MIELARLRSRQYEIKEGNISEVWKASIVAESGIYNVYIKHVKPHIVYAEAVCAMAGRELGLDIPKPFIVVDGDSLLFASEDVSYASFKQFINTGDRAIEQALLQWSGLDAAVIFDEWIANGDRNQGNFLYDGNGDFTLIDHGKAFGGDDWNVTNPQFAPENQLANCINIQGDLKKHQLRKSALNSDPIYESLNKPTICNHHLLDQVSTVQIQEDVLNFLTSSSESLVSMIKKRTGVLQLS